MASFNFGSMVSIAAIKCFNYRTFTCGVNSKCVCAGQLFCISPLYHKLFTDGWTNSIKETSKMLHTLNVLLDN